MMAKENLEMYVIFLFLTCGCFLVNCAEDKSDRYGCEDDWSYIEFKCVRIFNVSVLWPEAYSECKKQSGSLVQILTRRKQNFLKRKLSRTGRNVWIGLRKDCGSESTYEWYGYPKSFRVPYTRWQNEPDESDNYRYVLMRSSGYWYPMKSTSVAHFICEKKSQCLPGRYGEDCRQECHCHGVPCNKNNNTCVYGCQSGWMGSICDIRKQEPHVSSYCFNSEISGMEMLLRVDTKGVPYQDIIGLKERGNIGDSCNITDFEKTDNGVLSIRIQVLSNGTTFPDCPRKRITKSTLRWKFTLAEIENIISASDRVLEVTCDFSKADKLERQIQSDVQDLIRVNVVHIDKTTEDVRLLVKDPADNGVLRKVEIGTPVKLVMELDDPKDMGAVGISPFNCHCTSKNGAVKRMLTDYEGCSVPGSPVSPLTGKNGTLSSQWFEAFTVEWSRFVVFDCNFEYCFSPGELKCDDRCKYHEQSKHKRSAEKHEEKSGHAFTKLHILLSDRDSSLDDVEAYTLNGRFILYLNLSIAGILFLFVTSVLVLYIRRRQHEKRVVVTE